MSVPRPHRTRGFSLVELLVVIVIIGIVLAIIFPALSGGRQAARRAATQALMADIGVAASRFEQDNRRPAGYFTSKQMGSRENIDRGFSSMNNIMLDLVGGTVADEGTDIVRVGPLNDTRSPNNFAFVDLNKIGVSATGASNKAYLTIDPKFFIATVQRGTGLTGFLPSTAGAAAKKFGNVDGHWYLPDVVDSWGSPILAWSQAENPRYRDSSDKFGAIYVEQDKRPFVYWSQNAPFLQSQRLGKLETSQVDATIGSILGAPRGSGNPGIPGSLAGLLGNPAYPETDSTPPRPTAMRAPLVLHSAGANGVYLGREEDGGKRAGSGGNFELQYRPSVDAFQGFDDVLQTAGN